MPRTCILLLSFLLPLSAFSQQRPERTIDEIKSEAIKRAQNGMYPLIGLDPADVQEAFQSIKTKDKDEWAAAFMRVADRYMNEGRSLEKTDPAKANADYIRAWRLYSFGRWPFPASPKKQESYNKAIEAFLAHAHFWDPPLEVVHIPFEGSEIIGYLRLPKGTNQPAPLVIAVNGLDSRKEDLSESFAAILPFGIGFLAVDGPGTGQAPIKVSPNADRMLSRVIDYAQSRSEIDKNRIAVHGVSWGAYWATKLAIVERNRIRGASAQSPPVDEFFHKDFLMNSLLGNREYLFDQVPALMNIFDNIKTVDELADALEKMSFAKQNLLGQMMAPMLILAGVLDTQVPISDIYLLLSKGETPKDAWVNPRGGHLGRQVKVWPDPIIFKQVIIPWLVRDLAPEDPDPPAQPSENYSGMYTFLKDGEFVQITVEDAGRVTGFISRYGDGESDRGAFLDQFFKEGKLESGKLSFTTDTVHGVWFGFSGTLERGEGKTPADEGYHIVKGTLREYRTDASKKATSRDREVTLKSFPQKLDATPPR